MKRRRHESPHDDRPLRRSERLGRIHGPRGVSGVRNLAFVQAVHGRLDDSIGRAATARILLPETSIDRLRIVAYDSAAMRLLDKMMAGVRRLPDRGDRPLVASFVARYGTGITREISYRTGTPENPSRLVKWDGEVVDDVAFDERLERQLRASLFESISPGATPSSFGSIASATARLSVDRSELRIDHSHPGTTVVEINGATHPLFARFLAGYGGRVAAVAASRTVPSIPDLDPRHSRASWRPGSGLIVEMLVDAGGGTWMRLNRSDGYEQARQRRFALAKLALSDNPPGAYDNVVRLVKVVDEHRSGGHHLIHPIEDVEQLERYEKHAGTTYDIGSIHLADEILPLIRWKARAVRVRTGGRAAAFVKKHLKKIVLVGAEVPDFA